MAESSPLEAAAQAAYEEEAKGHRGPYTKWAWDDPPGRNQRHERWREIARAAIAAYEAEQTTPDPGFERVNHVRCSVCGAMGNADGSWPKTHSELHRQEA